MLRLRDLVTPLILILWNHSMKKQVSSVAYSKFKTKLFFFHFSQLQDYFLEFRFFKEKSQNLEKSLLFTPGEWSKSLQTYSQEFLWFVKIADVYIIYQIKLIFLNLNFVIWDCKFDNFDTNGVFDFCITFFKLVL